MRYFKAALLALILVTSVSIAPALDDGFGSAESLSGRCTVVYSAPKTDPADLIRRLNMRPSDRLLAGEALGEKGGSGDDLPGLLDLLYVRVSNILDMHIENLKIDIKVCASYDQLKNIYNRLFGEDLQDKEAFYVHSLNTIYVSRDGFTREIIGHELAHAIICYYFVKPPPVKIQEILAMYVEYNLRRADRQ